MTEENQEEHEYTCGEFEEMDLSGLRDKLFMVAISTGPRNEPKYIPETICGPYDFYEMIETVGAIYKDQQLNAKAFVPSKTFGEPPQVLDENTIDFIEARYEDIAIDGLLDGSVLVSKEYTCTADFIKPEESEEEA